MATISGKVEDANGNGTTGVVRAYREQRPTRHEPTEKQTFVHTGNDSAYAFGDGSFEAFVTSSQNSAVARLSRRDVITRKNSKVAL